MNETNLQTAFEEEYVSELHENASKTSLMFFDIVLSNIEWYHKDVDGEIPADEGNGFYVDDMFQYYIYIDALDNVCKAYPSLKYHDIITSIAFDTYLQNFPEGYDIAANITVRDIWIEEVH